MKNPYLEVYSDRTDLSPGGFTLLCQLTVRRRQLATRENMHALWAADQLVLQRSIGATKALANASNMSLSYRAPDVIVFDNEPEWPDAHARWLTGKNPTDDPAWKLGCFLFWLQP